MTKILKVGEIQKKETKDNYYIQKGVEVQVKENDSNIWGLFTLTRDCVIERVSELDKAPIGWRCFTIENFKIRVREEYVFLLRFGIIYN